MGWVWQHSVANWSHEATPLRDQLVADTRAVMAGAVRAAAVLEEATAALDARAAANAAAIRERAGAPTLFSVGDVIAVRIHAEPHGLSRWSFHRIVGTFSAAIQGDRMCAMLFCPADPTTYVVNDVHDALYDDAAKGDRSIFREVSAIHRPDLDSSYTSIHMISIRRFNDGKFVTARTDGGVDGESVSDVEIYDPTKTYEFRGNPDLE